MTDLKLLQMRQRQARARAAVEEPSMIDRLQRFNEIQRNIRDSIAEGVTLGFAPEIAAGIDALMQGMPYSAALEREEARMSEIPTGQRIIGNIAGGVLSAPMLGLRAPAGVAQAARQGAGLGTLSGAGFAEGGLPERARGAAVGGALGGPLAAGGQALVGAIGRAIARARQGVTGPVAKAMDDVLDNLRAGEITPEQAAARVQRLGPEGVLADIPELQRLAQQTASRTGTGQRIAQTTLESRTRGGGARVEQALDDAFSGRPLREVRQGIVSTRAAEARPLYDKALSVGPLELTDDLAALVGRPGQRGSGSSLVRGQMESIRRSNPRFRDAPDTDPELLHAVRVALGERTKGQGATKRNINDVVQQLTDAMDDAGATGYREAVDTFRQNSKIIEAFDLGRKALTDLPENISAFLKQATSGENEAFVAGLGRELLKRLETGETGNAAQGVRAVLRGERAQIIREALGPEGFNTLRNRLLRELGFAQTAGRVLGGSPTQPRQAAGLERMKQLGRVERAVEGLRTAGPISGATELALAAGAGGPSIPRERALAQLLFRSQGQGLSRQQFGGRTPLLELAQRERLLAGSAPVRAAIPGAAAIGAGRGGNPLLGLAGF